MNDSRSVKDLRRIPGIGPNLAAHLIELGVHAVAELKGRDPQELYDRLVAKYGSMDRCVLYAFRCAVYFASTDNPSPELLKWWNWKDKK